MYPVQTSTGALKASGSQFFISFMTLPQSSTPLDIFGTVTEGMDVVLQLAHRRRRQTDYGYREVTSTEE